jgi:hypothetical protein
MSCIRGSQYGQGVRQRVRHKSIEFLTVSESNSDNYVFFQCYPILEFNDESNKSSQIG